MYARTVVCAKGHRTEALYKDAATFEKLQKMKRVACETCGSTKVEVELAAPRISRGETAAGGEEESREDVGDRFADEMHAILDGDKPDRPMRGTATLEQAGELLERGAEITPLPKLDS